MSEAQTLLQIGFLETDQHEAMVDLLHEMSRHYNGEQGASSREVVRANFLSRILGPDSDVHLVTASRDGRVLGFAAISLLYPAPKERAQLFMKELYVAAECRSDGIGAALMRWIAAHALRMGCVRFDWTVDADNRRGLAFYEELGARHVPEKLYFRFAGEELERFAAGE